MTENTLREASTPGEIADLFVEVREGNRFTLTYETPDGEEKTVRAEAATDAQMTERSRDEPAKGNVAFWYRDLDRAEGDTEGVPYATVRYRPVYSTSPPVVRIHGHTPTPEATAGMEYLGDATHVVVGVEPGEQS